VRPGAGQPPPLRGSWTITPSSTNPPGRAWGGRQGSGWGSPHRKGSQQAGLMPNTDEFPWPQGWFKAGQMSPPEGLLLSPSRLEEAAVCTCPCWGACVRREAI